MLEVKWIGEFTPRDVHEFLTRVTGAIAEHSLLFVIVDARRAGGWYQGARKEFIERARQVPVAAVAYIGAGLTIRVLVGMLTNASKLLGHPMAKVAFVNGDDEARAFIEALRRETVPHGPSAA